MAEIKYGKGIGGFLGSMPTIDYQYTPMPFNEMLSIAKLGFGMRQANDQATADINKLYDTPVLGVDQSTFDEKQEVFTNKLKDQVSKSGGSLGQLNSFLNQELRSFGADKTYIGATNSAAAYKKDLEDTAKTIKDPILQQYYPQQALNNYTNLGGAASGASYSPISQRSTLTSTSARKIFSDAVGRIKPQQVQELQQFQNQEGVTQQQLVKYKQKKYDDIKNHLTDLFNNNTDLQVYYQDFAEATGQDYKTLVDKVIAGEARMGQVFDLSESKITNVGDGTGKKDSDYAFIGSAFDVDLSSMYGTEKVQDAFKMLENDYNTGNMSYDDYTAKRSLLQVAANKAGLTPDDLAAIEYFTYGYDKNQSVRAQQRAAEKYGPQGAEKIAQRFQTAWDEVTASATINPVYEQFTSTKGAQQAAITALSERTLFDTGMTVEDVKVGNEWQVVEDQSDINTSQVEIVNVSTRPYFDYNTNQEVIRIEGKLKTGKRGEADQIFRGTIPTMSVAGLSKDLDTYYNSPTMKELSRLMVTGQKVGGSRMNEFTEVMRQTDTENDPNLQDKNHTYAVRADSDGNYTLLLINKVTTDAVATADEGLEVTKPTLTELATFIDKIIEQHANKNPQ